MPSNCNKVIIACAGSGKTTLLVEEALSRPQNSVAILTYTNNNAAEIRQRLIERCGGIPSHVNVFTWFAFLLRECARPYQRSIYAKRRIQTVCFAAGRSAQGIPHTKTERYYFNNGCEIYSDKISRFSIDCDVATNGCVTARLNCMYDEILIDEIQDLAGWDLDVVEMFLNSDIRVTMVGDPRQCTYATNNGAKNSQYRGEGFLELARIWERGGKCRIETLNETHRCNQRICEFTDRLWPNLPTTKSLASNTTVHDGVFCVAASLVHEYVQRFSPRLLRYDNRAITFGYPALNFGAAKGLQFDRVLIIPHGPMKKYLETGSLSHVLPSLEKFYVAVTRARHSVAFLFEGDAGERCVRWNLESVCSP